MKRFGVLQPPSKQTRFKHDLKELRRSLADRFGDETYLDMDKYDLGAVYHAAVTTAGALATAGAAAGAVTSGARPPEPITVVLGRQAFGRFGNRLQRGANGRGDFSPATPRIRCAPAAPYAAHGPAPTVGLCPRGRRHPLEGT